MRVPLSWLRELAPFDLDPIELGRTFDDLGMVVEGLERVGEGLGGVVVARVVEIHGIPGADKIRRVLVDAGGPDAVEVVCGAWNFQEGDLVPLATVGSVLPGGFEIAQRKMRGVTSNGMLCSSRELALGDDHAGILVLPPEVEPGAPFAEAMGIEADVVYDLAIETNRPDAMSVVGVARDAAARLGIPFVEPAPPPLAAAPVDAASSGLAVVDDPDLCPLFTTTVLDGVSVGPSPAWLARRLALAGMRSISNLVDVSNYVMLELGQPTHPYDLDLLPGRGLRVRRARPGEAVTTLDGVERRLGDGDDLLICDAEGSPVGIAGIMGGASSEISGSTTTCLLEAAWFKPMAIARTAKRIGLRSEASARFERGVDIGGVERAVARFVELASQLAGAAPRSHARAEDAAHVPDRSPIRVRTDRVNSLLGTALSRDDVVRLIAPIGFEASEAEGGALDVVAPTWRPDVRIEVDVIEEVARHHGYPNIARSVPRSPIVGGLSPFQRERRLVRSTLVGAGLTEAQTPSLVGPGDHERAAVPPPFVEAADPLVKEESVMRASLLPGLLRAIVLNQGTRQQHVALFEVGHVFRPPSAETAPLPVEREVLTAVIAGADATEAVHLWRRLEEALRLDRPRLAVATADGFHPSRTAAVELGGAVVGHVGEVDPDALSAWGVEGRVALLEVDLVALHASPRRPLTQEPISRYPSSDIDLAFAVDEAIPAASVEETLRHAGGQLLVDVWLFDAFRDTERIGPGRRSLAYHLRFCALDRTLTDADVASVRAACIAAVEQEHAATLRA